MRKKHSLRQNRGPLYFYIILHLAVISAFAVLVAYRGGLHINADLFSMMPLNSGAAGDQPVKSIADKALTEDMADNIMILISDKNFSRAKQTAQSVYEQLKDSSNFKTLSLYSDMLSMTEIKEFLHKYRYCLLDSQAVDLLSTQDGARKFADNALSKAYGVFTVSSIENFEEDPFLLDDYNFHNYLSVIKKTGTSMFPKDGVLATQHEGLWYVLVSGTLSKKGASLANDANGVAEIYSVCSPLEKDGTRFVYSGTPFHSYKSSLQAVREISVISSLSLVMVLSLLIFVFRSPLPIITSGFSILISCVFGFSVTYLAFRSIHVLALVFATSLIGCGIDYSLHFFINWKARKLQSYKGLYLSCLSTEICFACLYFAPFGLLKQVSVFCFSGILSAFLSVVCVYPLLALPKKNKDVLRIKNSFFMRRLDIQTSLFYTLLIILISGAVIYFNRTHLKVYNNVTNLYRPEGRLRDDAALANVVLKYSPTSWFIVSGKSIEEVLKTEESVCKKLSEIHEHSGYGFVATSMFIPSEERQKASVEAVKALLPLAERQYDMLGFGAEYAEIFKDSYETSQNSFITPEEPFPSYMQDLIDSLWLGKIGGSYYAVVLPSVTVSVKAYRELAQSFDNVLYADKVSDVGMSLDYLTKLVLMLFFISYTIILIVLKFFYSWRRVLKIASVPVLCVCVITAVFCAMGHSIDFFALIGIILVFGLGLDYIIYVMQEQSDRRIESFAVLLSFLTTALSFCTLAFSSFVPVHIIGLAIFAGLTAAFAATLF